MMSAQSSPVWSMYRIKREEIASRSAWSRIRTWRKSSRAFGSRVERKARRSSTHDRAC